MDDVLKNKPQEVILKINNIFNANLKGFFDNEKQKSRNVMELNKKYISLIINYIELILCCYKKFITGRFLAIYNIFIGFANLKIIPNNLNLI